MSNVVRFPNACVPLPSDAKPIGRACFVEVAPDMSGGWWVQECDDGGAMILGHGLTKWQAVEIALDWVHCWNAEMSIKNSW
jgi:hypothetical protein